MEYYDDSLTSRTFETKGPANSMEPSLSREKSGDTLKNLVKCAAPTIIRELSWGKHLVCLSHSVYGTITEVCRDYANRKLILDSR